MKTIELLNYINVICIWGMALSLVWAVAKMKFSLYRCFARLAFHKDPSCFNWLMNNKHYLLSILAIAFLISLSLGLLSQANLGLIEIRTEFTIGCTIGVWLMLCPIIVLLFIKTLKSTPN